MTTKIVIKNHRYLTADEISDEGTISLANAIVLQAVDDFILAYRAYLDCNDEFTRATLFAEEQFFLEGDLNYYTKIDGKWLLEQIKKKARKEWYAETHSARSGRAESLV